LATGGAEGGGGGGTRFAELFRAWLMPFTAARGWAGLGCEAAGWGTGLDCEGVWDGMGRGCGAAGWGTGREVAGLEASFDGPPAGPPGRSNFPFVTGAAAFGLPLGVGRDLELAGSPAPV